MKTEYIGTSLQQALILLGSKGLDKGCKGFLIELSPNTPPKLKASYKTTQEARAMATELNTGITQ